MHILQKYWTAPLEFCYKILKSHISFLVWSTFFWASIIFFGWPCKTFSISSHVHEHSFVLLSVWLRAVNRSDKEETTILPINVIYCSNIRWKNESGVSLTCFSEYTWCPDPWASRNLLTPDLQSMYIWEPSEHRLFFFINAQVA